MERMTTAEVAAMLGCSVARIRQLVGTKVLKPTGKIGQTYIFKRDAIVQYKAQKNGKKR